MVLMITRHSKPLTQKSIFVCNKVHDDIRGHITRPYVTLLKLKITYNSLLPSRDEREVVQ